MVKFVSLFVYLIVVLEVLAEVKTCHLWTSLLECISVTLWGASLPKPTMEGLWFGCFFQRFFGDDHDPFHWLVYHDFLSNCPIYFHWFACNFVAYFHGISYGIKTQSDFVWNIPSAHHCTFLDWGPSTSPEDPVLWSGGTEVVPGSR